MPRIVIDGLQPMETNKYQVEFDLGRGELESYVKTSVLRFGTNLLEEGGYEVNCIWVKWRMTNAPC